jgi:hypothetical protein
MTAEPKKQPRTNWSRFFYGLKLTIVGVLYLGVSWMAGYCVYLFVPVFSYQIISIFLIAILLSNLLAKLFIDFFNY